MVGGDGFEPPALSV